MPSNGGAARYVRVAGLLGGLAVAPAHAIYGGAGIDANVPGSPWAGVGSVLSGAGSFSGALIAPQYVITAAHVVHGVALQDIRFQLNAGAAQQIAAAAVFVNPGYTGWNPGPDGIVHNDLAIIQLASPAPQGVPFYALAGSTFNATDRNGADYLPAVALVGYGASNGAPASASVKRVGSNQVDFTSLSPAGRQAYAFDFDGPDLASNLLTPQLPAGQGQAETWGTLGSNVEATLGSGDSGSAAFVQLPDASWRLAGINTFVGGTPGAFGSFGGGMALASYGDWIQSVISPVPEPEPLVLALAGLGSVAAWRRRRRERGRG